jgi:hypothetical protein
MKLRARPHVFVRKLLFPLALGLTLLVSTTALAGEMKFGEGSGSLETDDDGKLTAAGKESVLKELDKIPGEDAWDLNVWLKLDKPKGVEGPLYVEFYQTVSGKEYIVHRHEIDYDGSKYWTEAILLEGNQGFNKDREYRVQVIQNDGKRDIKLAGAKIKLINTGREPEPGEGEGGEEEEEVSEQDVLDSLAPGAEEEEGADEPADANPPETESPTKKKGCSVANDYELGFSGLAILLFAGLGIRAQRRRRRD